MAPEPGKDRKNSQPDAVHRRRAARQERPDRHPSAALRARARMLLDTLAWVTVVSEEDGDNLAQTAAKRIDVVAFALEAAPWAPPDTPTWPWVNAFAHEMEAKLAENRHKGNRDGWLLIPPDRHLLMLEEEIRELRHELGRPLVRATKRLVVRECADIGNVAMMIADVAGGMQPRGETR